MTEWPVQNKHICCNGFSIFNLKFRFLKMISPRNVELPPWSMTFIGVL